MQKNQRSFIQIVLGKMPKTSAGTADLPNGYQAPNSVEGIFTNVRFLTAHGIKGGRLEFAFLKTFQKSEMNDLAALSRAQRSASYINKK